MKVVSVEPVASVEDRGPMGFWRVSGQCPIAMSMICNLGKRPLNDRRVMVMVKKGTVVDLEVLVLILVMEGCRPMAIDSSPF
jgi:hypothetical protein